MNEKTGKCDYKIRGCICKKPSSPYLYAEITYKLADGTVKRISKTTKCKRKYDAVKRMDEMIRKLEDELSFGGKEFHELTEFIKNWLERVESREIEATTLETYRRQLTAYIEPYFKPLNLSVEELRPVHLWEFVEHMQDQCIKTGTFMKTCSIKKVLSNIKLAMDYAVKKEIIEMNPAASIELKTKRKENFTPSYYTIEQLMRLWKAVKGTIYEPVIVLASIYAFRRGEVSGLKWDKVNFEQRSIRIDETIVYAGSKPHRKCPKTESSIRTMPMISPVRSYLLKIMEQQKEKANQMGKGWVNSGYVVVDDFGAPLRPMRISNSFKRILEENGLPPIRFHDLRHSVATYMLSMGVPIAEISAWLGHKSVSTTSNIYAHVTDDMRKHAAKWMDASFDPDNNKDQKGITLDEAISRLFDNVLSGGLKKRLEETKINRNEPLQLENYINCMNNHQEVENGKLRENEQTREIPRLRVIRGKLA